MPTLEQSRTFQHVEDWRDLQRQLHGQMDRPVRSVLYTVGAEATDKRRFTMQVVDRLGRPWRGKFKVELFVATSEGGNPGGAQVLTVVGGQGFLAQAVIADVWLVALTNASGVLAIDAEVAGAGNRWMYAQVDQGPFLSSGQQSWI